MSMKSIQDKLYALVPVMSAMLILLFFASCSKSSPFNLESDSYYRFTYEGEDGFIKVGNKENKIQRGIFYRISDGPVSEPVSISITTDRKSIEITEEDSTSIVIPRKDFEGKVSLTKYENPDYAPSQFDLSLYRDSLYNVKTIKNKKYGEAKGYYVSLTDNEKDYTSILFDGMRNHLFTKMTDLNMDIYMPDEDSPSHPLIMFIHGGAFCAGDKEDASVVDMCRWFASRGYVTASINYRLGFHVRSYLSFFNNESAKQAFRRAEYRAVQDANAAMRYLVSNADEYNIDTHNIFVTGSSAGATTALNMAYMTDQDAAKMLGMSSYRQLGGLHDSSNDIRADYTIKSVASMWGALPDLNMLRNAHTDITLFHGTNDEVIPYAEGRLFIGYPRIYEYLTDYVYGSLSIHRKASDYAVKTDMYAFEGEGHFLNEDKDNKPSEYHQFIKDKICERFFAKISGGKPVIHDQGNGTYSLDGNDHIQTIQWDVVGGFIIGGEENKVQILWRDDAEEQSLSACGSLDGGLGFEVKHSKQYD